jgi:type IV secretory pathway VirB10-like protein
MATATARKTRSTKSLSSAAARQLVALRADAALAELLGFDAERLRLLASREAMFRRAPDPAGQTVVQLVQRLLHVLAGQHHLRPLEQPLPGPGAEPVEPLDSADVRREKFEADRRAAQVRKHRSLGETAAQRSRGALVEEEDARAAAETTPTQKFEGRRRTAQAERQRASNRE